jgi:hypothetical protein
MKLLLLITLALVATPILHAQLAVGGAFTVQRLTFDPDIVPGTLDAGAYTLTGGTFNAQAQFGGLVRFGFDIRGTVTRGGGRGVNSFAFGPRLALIPPRIPVQPYIEGLIGGAYVRSNFSPLYTGRYADYTFAVGADVPLKHHLTWRAFEYSHSTVSGEDIRNQFSTGVLFHFL